jgi:hypothetical protein
MNLLSYTSLGYIALFIPILIYTDITTSSLRIFTIL